MFLLIIFILLLNSPKAFSTGEGDFSSSGKKDSSPDKCRKAVRSLSDFTESIKTQEPKKHLAAILMLPIEVLNFPVSSQETFKSNNINHLVELAVRTEEELLGMPGFESQNLIEVKDVLSKMGLKLGMNVDWLLEGKEEEQSVKNLSPGEKPQVTTVSVESHPFLALPVHPFLALPVQSLDLSVRSSNALRNENIKYIGELVQKTEAETLRMKNFERKSLAEIKDVLSGLGLQLGMTIVDWPSDSESLEKLEAQAKKIEELEAQAKKIYEGLTTSVISVETHPILALPIENLEELSVRSFITLQHENIKYIGELVQKTEAEALRMKNFERKSLAEIKDVLSGLGLHLGMTVVDWPSDSESLEEWEAQARNIYQGLTTSITSIEWHPILVFPIDDFIDDLKLSVRSSNALRFVRSSNALRNEYRKYLGDLAQMTEKELLKVPNCGRKCLAEIKEVLSGLGLRLGMVVVDWPPGLLKSPEEQAKGSIFVSIELYPILALPIENLALSVRSSNALRNENIKYLGELAQRTEEDLLRTPSFGRKSLAEIKEVLSRFWLQLGMIVVDWPHDSEKLKKSEEQAFSEFFPTLTSREEKILRMRFGIGEENPHTYKEIGQVFNVPRWRIQVIQERTLRKLKRHPFARYVFGEDAIISSLDSNNMVERNMVEKMVEELFKRMDERKKQAPASPGNTGDME